jgi:hypothetical protein
LGRRGCRRNIVIISHFIPHVVVTVTAATVGVVTMRGEERPPGSGSSSIRTWGGHRRLGGGPGRGRRLWDGCCRDFNHSGRDRAIRKIPHGPFKLHTPGTVTVEVTRPVDMDNSPLSDSEDCRSGLDGAVVFVGHGAGTGTLGRNWTGTGTHTGCWDWDWDWVWYWMMVLAGSNLDFKIWA